MAFNQFAPGSFKIHTEPTSLSEKLEVGTYVLNNHPMIGYYLDRTENFTVPPKIYGEANDYPELIFERAFTDRSGKVTTAVLSGIKGSGKTLTAKQASILGLAAGMPTFIINNPYCGDSFTEFLQDLNKQVGPFILLIDEFEKIYTEQEQLNALLTLLDGTATLNMLVLLTMNSTLDEARFEFFKNRPGRTYFNIYFPPCSDDVIREYCADHLEDVEKTEMIVAFTRRFTSFTLDMLTTLVYEYNKSKDKDLLRITEVFNIKPDVSVSNESYALISVHKTDLQPRKGVSDTYNFAPNVLRYQQHWVQLEIGERDPEFKKLEANWGDLEKSDFVSINPMRFEDFDDEWEVPRGLRDEWKKNKDTDPERLCYFRVNLRVELEPSEKEAADAQFDVRIDYANRQVVFTSKDFDLQLILAASAPRPAKRLLLL